MKVSSLVIAPGVSNPATPYGRLIVEQAEAIAYARCREDDGRPNRSTCVDAIHTAFSGKPPVSEPWCAKVAWVVAERAAKAGYGRPTILPHTAGALDMYRRAMATPGLVVDQTPAVGAVGYRRSMAEGATGHIFVVKGYDDSRVYTVEGNVGPEAGGGMWWAFYDRDDLERMGARYIHVERQMGETPEGESFLAGADALGFAMLATAALGWYYYTGAKR